MKKILPILVIGILILSGFGAVAFENEPGNNKIQSRKIFQNQL